jgi:hypothetical protein
MAVKFANNATTTLAAPLLNSVSALTMQVVDGGRFPIVTPGSGDWFPVTVVQAATGLWEIMRCTSHVTTSMNVLGVDRAEEGTTILGSQFVGGDRVDLRMTAGALSTALTELETEVNADMDALEASLTAAVNAKPVGNQVTRLYVANGNWSKPAPVGTATVPGKLKSLSVLVVAGGGGGAGVPATAAGQFRAGGGGGAGGSSYKVFTTAEINTMPTTVSVVVGAGGAGGTSGNGVAGKTSSFFGVVANGGQPGLVSAAATAAGGPLPASGGEGGGSGSGSINYWGQQGGLGLACIDRAVYSRGGAGGTSPYGNAQPEYWGDHVAGVAGIGYAVGGSGAANGVSKAAIAGGAGSPGFVLITEYY